MQTFRDFKEMNEKIAELANLRIQRRFLDEKILSLKREIQEFFEKMNFYERYYNRHIGLSVQLKEAPIRHRINYDKLLTRKPEIYFELLNERILQISNPKQKYYLDVREIKVMIK